MHASSIANFVLTAALAVVPTLTSAGDARSYDSAAFKAAQTAGKPIVIEIHADWCTECKMQNLILNKLSGQPHYTAMVRLRVDYDKQKEAVKEFRAKKQSTLIVYRGEKEIARAVGITSEEKIRALLDGAL
jgi:thioredoxin 1